MLFVFISLFFVSGVVDKCNGAIYYQNGVALSGDDLIEECYSNQVCNTHFAKNVYATSSPVLDHEWTPLLFPEMYDQFDSESTCGSGSKFISMDTCAQIHSPMTLYHNEGEVKVSYVQEQYSLKWQNIRQSQTPIYDAFLDNSVAYWVDDLSKYHSLWTEIGADIVYLKWTVKNLASDDSDSDDETVEETQYYSLITHNGDSSTGSTLTQYELISDTFSGLTDEILNTKMLNSEQRAFFDSESDYRSFSVGCETLPIGARRAVTSLDDNIEWYKKIFAASITDVNKQIIQDEYIDYNGNIVKYAHIKLYQSEESTTISFFEREMIDSTYGDFTVLDFEKAMTDTHNENMISPYCGIDRWFDMHYAVSFDDSTISEKILQTMMNSGEKYTVYEEWATQAADGQYPTFVYMTEPNGHSVQLIFDSDSDITFLTSPQQWDAKWCPLECTDEMSSYDYGDVIATFGWDDDTQGSDTSAQLNGNNIKIDITTQEQHKQGIFSLIFLILGVFTVISVILMIGYYPHCTCDRFKYQQLPQ